MSLTFEGQDGNRLQLEKNGPMLWKNDQKL